jgi:hypothetical protein
MLANSAPHRGMSAGPSTSGNACMRQSICPDCAEPDTGGDTHTLQYEVLMPGGWQRGRKQKGTVKLSSAVSAFATVAVSAVPVAPGRVSTPTLIMLPQGMQSVRGGNVWIDVAEAR